MYTLREDSLTPSCHALLLLSDSALPLGSFAFSSGLESYLAHHKPFPASTSSIVLLYHFLALSISSLAGTTLPYIIAAYREPVRLQVLDNDLDASIPCTVARRASVAQGRALLNVWERSLRSMSPTSSTAADTLATFSAALKLSSAPDLCGANGHMAPLWAIVCLVMNVSIEQCTYVFFFNHAKAVLSAAVRASVVGPYQAQAVLASTWLQMEINEVLERNWAVPVEEAAQCAPLMDLWIGRHDLLYSRIFNS